ncbi:MAG: glycosyltransferase, partial [Rhodomicrobium sp.]
MLQSCLTSLSKLTPIEGVETEIIVIDNEPEGSEKARAAAERFGAHYRHQPERGIPQARNAALDTARELGATHLAFIDDDETADREWLAALWAAAVKFDADVVQGAVRYVFPQDAPKWRQRSGHAARKEKTGDPLAFVGTNNVLFRLDSIGETRFDEALRLLGGEDITFFDAVEKRGCRIVFCREALTFETVPW